MLAGVLVDVSGSMFNALQLDVILEDPPVTRVQSIFSTIISIVDGDGGFTENEEMFALAFGLQIEGINTCDLLALLDDIRRLNRKYETTGRACLIKLIEENGAPFVGEFIEKHLSQQAAGNLFDTFSQEPNLLKDTVDKLPLVCKNLAAYSVYTSNAYSAGKAVHSAAKVKVHTIRQKMSSFFEAPSWSFFQNHGSSSAASNSDEDYTQKVLIKSYEEQIAEKCIDEGIQSCAAIKLKTMLKPKNRRLNDVVTILQEIANPTTESSTSKQKRLTAAQLSHLVDVIKPYIFGDTPMCEALGYALETFQSNDHTTKVLFVLSDGEAKDGDPVKLAEKLHSSGVIVFACLVTSKNIREPRRLYDISDLSWSKEQCDMFAMSSVVSNQSPAMAILLKKKWELPSSGQSRLFLQANHPEVIEEFSSLLREIGRSNDALLDMLGCVSLDLYINIKSSMFEAQDQMEARTCYAYAVATVFHLAMSRIGGRDDGVPEFATIREQLINDFGKESAIIEDVLKQRAHEYRLQYKKVDELEARQAINARHSLVATFGLTKQQWDAFKAFYRDNPKGILQAKDLPIADLQAKKSKHAVVLMRCDATSLTLMNSWGTIFANGGFFKIKDQSVLNLAFYDVFWELKDLTETEKAAYQSRCRDLAQELAETLPLPIRNLLYDCPQCHHLAPANQFTGHLLEATCPKCHQNFKPSALGLMRYLYTS